MNKRIVDVAIVGAGLAGLTAAHDLINYGYSIAILEARHRPGGRIKTLVSDDDVTIDLGAQWVGKSHHRMLNLIKKYGLELTPTFQNGDTIVVLDGKRKTTKGKIPYMSPFAKFDLIQVRRKLNKISKEINPIEPWNSKVAQQLDEVTLEAFLKEQFYSSRAFEFCRLLIEELLCAHLYEISALDFIWCIKSAGSVEALLEAEGFWIKEGAGTLVHKLTQPLQENILYNEPVRSIHYDGNDVKVQSENEQVSCKKVIVAVPPNFISKINVNPPLPASYVQMSERASLPSVIKVICVYSHPFWRSVGLSGMSYSANSLVTLTVDSSPEDEKKGVLTAIIGGTAARKLETVSCDQLHHAVKEALVQLFGEKAAIPLSIYEKDWSSDVWTRGGYGTHFPPGVIKNVGYALMKPVGPIHWAGTETASEWRMYMEGAVQSGERVAAEVIESLTT
ncbi:FAD-dependent oxidoreductase [Alkalihalobacillus sp. MEB130]|uniref:flavin monoamine oxidase family protein n=1 Tax=Alkalihalobacillus sp. MEB130 TaxID=2976704 RepID=UPI0028DEA517|nr:FAD-dependent oxidoreductase [Alkalihalobacillus sp. MEB130]MDT8859752.1 FAD-dependent oxidoreductase [Alkalihalobacillus sp. MEB130]